MIRLKKIKSLKERVQMRKCADVFFMASKGQISDELDDIFLYYLTLIDPVYQKKAEKAFRDKRYSDLYYMNLEILGESVADWDFFDEKASLDASRRTVLDHFLYLDGIRSPYNTGSIFRSADAFGVKKIFLRPLSASPLHERARRTSMDTVNVVEWEEKELSDIHDLPVFALELGGMDIWSFEFPERALCVIGSEEEGISSSSRKRAEESLGLVSIPMLGAKGSVNVASAAAILLALWANSSRMRNRFSSDGPQLSC